VLRNAQERASGPDVDCDERRIVHTVGHSTRSLETLVRLLRDHAIALLVDVRRWPVSRRYPHFRRESLELALAQEPVEYQWRGDLGGYRTPAPDSPNAGWRVGAFRAYADFMLTPEFDRIMRELEAAATRARLAVMCAEAMPWRCHRQLLADAFTVRGWAVRHILDQGCTPHRLPPFARPEGMRIRYPSDDACG
jgi:uncharacterized protein (DUF488 family)